MWYYWIITVAYIFALKFLFRGIQANKRKQLLFIFLCFLPVFFLMAFRNPELYKGDLFNYSNYFLRVGESSWSTMFKVTERFEPGYIIFNKLLYLIAPWRQSIVIAESLFALTAVGYFIYKNTDDPFYAVLTYLALGILNFQMTGFRQSFAIGILMFSTEFIKKRKLIPFLLLIALAFSFHKTSVIFIFAYFFLNKKLSAFRHIIIAVITIVTGYYMEIILKFSVDLFETDEYTVAYLGNRFGGLVIIVVFASIVLLSVIYRRKQKNPLIFNAVETGVFIYILRYISIIIERVSLYYSFAAIAALPEVLNMEENKKIRDMEKIFYSLLLAAYFIYTASYSKWAKFIPFWS